MVIMKSFLFLQNAILKTSLFAAVEEQKNADQKVLKLAERKKQKEELHKRIISLRNKSMQNQQVKQKMSDCE